MQLSLKTFGGVLLVVLFAPSCIFLITRATPNASAIVGLLQTVSGGFLGVAFSLFFLASFSLIPAGRKHHWTTSISKIVENGEDINLLWLRSHCFHKIRYLQCTVVDPGGAKWQANFRGSYDQDVYVLQPNESVGFEYPKDFQAPPPPAGKYKISWTSLDTDAKKRVNLLSTRWHIPTPWSR